MAVLTQRDLSVLARTKATIKKIRLVPVNSDGKQKYEIHLEIEGASGIEHCQMITNRNEPQRWTSINRAIEMLEEYTNEQEFVVVRSQGKD